MGKADRKDLGDIRQDRINKSTSPIDRRSVGDTFEKEPTFAKSSSVRLALGHLTDVNLPATITTSHVLLFDGPSIGWRSATVGVGALALNDLSDVDTSGVNTDDVITFNGTTWTATANVAGAGDDLGNHIATKDLSMASFDVENVSEIRFKAGGENNQEIVSNAGSLRLKVATADTIRFLEGTTLGMEFNRAGNLDLYMATHDIRQIAGLFFNNAPSIADVGGNLQYNVPLADEHQFQVGSIEKMRVVSNEVFMSTGIDMNTFTIDNFTSLVQSGLPSISGSIRLRNDVAIAWHVASDSVSASGNFKYNTSDQFEMDSDLSMATSDIEEISEIRFKAGGGDDQEIVSNATSLRIKVATADTIRFLEGTTLGMEFNRGGNLDLYMATHDIRQIAGLFFNGGGSIADVGGNIQYNAPLADEHQFQIGSIEKMTINSDTVQVAAVITMDENTLPATPVANDVVFYAKDDGGVSKLFYRSDDGTEVGPLGGGGLTAHNILSSTHGDTSPSIAPVTDDVLTWTGTEWLATDQISAVGDDLGNHTATQDLHMASFDVENVSEIRFKAGGTDDQEIVSNASSLRIKIATADTLRFIEGTTLGMEFNRGGNLDLFMATHDIRQISGLFFNNAPSIADVGGNLEFNAPLADELRFQIGSIEKMRVVSNEVFMSTGIDMNTFTIDNFTSLVQSGLPSISGAIRLRNDVAIGWHVASDSVSASGLFKYNTSDAFEMDSNLDMTSNIVTNLATPTVDRDAANKKYVDDNAGGGHVIEDEGTPLTQRADMNFVGAGVTAADSGGKTVVTIPSAGGGAGFPLTPTVDVIGTVSTATFSIDLSLATAHHHTMTLATDTTIEFKNPPATDVSIQFELDVTQDSTGGRTLSYENDLLTTAPAVKTGSDDRTILIAQTQHPTTTAAYTIFDTALRADSVFVPSAFTDLTDVTISGGVTNNDHLQFDGGTSIWRDRRSLEFGATPAITGDIRLSNNKAIEWRNQSGGSDLGIKLGATDRFEFDTDLDTRGNNIILNVGGDSEIDVVGDAIFMKTAGDISWSYAVSGGSHSANNNKIAALTTPATNDEAANKGYVDSIVVADDLGNHTATQDLKMAGFAIFNASQYETSATSPSSTGVFRAGNNQVIGWRNKADDGNLEVKANDSDFFDFTDSSNGNVSIQLRAQDAVVADKIGTITQDSGAVGPMTLQTGTEILLDIGANTVVNIDTTRVKMFQDLNMATNEIGNVNALIFDVFGTVGKDIAKFSTGLHYDIENTAHQHLFRVDGDPPANVLGITSDEIVPYQDIIPSAGTINLGGAVNSGGSGNPFNNIYSDNTIFIRNIKHEDGVGNDINVFEDLDMQAGAQIDFDDVSTSAGTSNRTLPAQPDGFIIIKVSGASKRVPFYVP